ncbi:putative reverse transcriptase domain-containing protein [Tanacetum coccineum]
MSMTIQSGIEDKILATSSETPKVENAPAEMLRDMDQQMEKRADDVEDDCDYQTLAELSYNNSYHSSIQYALFEAWYGRKCRSHVLWAEIQESSLIGPKLVQETTDKVVVIKEKLQTARDRQKSYADRPFEILKRGPVAYRLRFLEELIRVHDTFHVSNLKKCLGNANLHVPLNEIKIDKTLCFAEEPIEIIDREVKSL